MKIMRAISILYGGECEALAAKYQWSRTSASKSCSTFHGVHDDVDETRICRFPFRLRNHDVRSDSLKHPAANTRSRLDDRHLARLAASARSLWRPPVHRESTRSGFRRGRGLSAVELQLPQVGGIAPWANDGALAYAVIGRDL